MKVTYNWLRDFVEIKISPEKLADKLTMAGFEVTSLEEKDNDFIFEIEVTSNRADLLSVLGIAREVAAITGNKLKITSSGKHKKESKSIYNTQPLFINVLDRKDCPLYTAKLIVDVKVATSPDWLKRRLELIGCRSINNIVDITNYILFTYGQPLHAFDFDRLSSNTIFVRRAKKGDRLVTIDGKERILSQDILVIADEERPVAIAGIMGGRESEVKESTTKILLEAAVFDPLVVRRMRQQLGLQSESAYRFERGVDFTMVEFASLKAAELMERLAGAKIIAAKATVGYKPKVKTIIFDPISVYNTLNIKLPPLKIKKILTSLGLLVRMQPIKNRFIVRIPFFRRDLNMPIDLVEEIARIHGYKNIPSSLPYIKPQINNYKRRDLVDLVRNTLVGLGLNEVITYSLIDRDILSAFNLSADYRNTVEIMNPLSNEQEILRPTLLPSLARCIAYNLNQKQDYVTIFEIANLFFEDSGIPKEECALGIGICGTRSLLLSQGAVTDTLGLWHLKGIFESLSERLGIKNYTFAPDNETGYIYIYLDEVKLGLMMKLSRDILERLDIKNKEVFLLELRLERFLSYAKLERRYTPLAKYPFIRRDLSFIIKEDISIKDVLDTIKQQGGALLSSLKLIDFYRGKQIPSGYRSLTVCCIYRAENRTLTEEEINPIHTHISEVLREKFAAELR